MADRTRMWIAIGISIREQTAESDRENGLGVRESGGTHGNGGYQLQVNPADKTMPKLNRVERNSAHCLPHSPSHHRTHRAYYYI